MKTLLKEFTKNQFDFKQLKRVGDVVLYEKQKEGHKNKTYEIGIVGSHEDYYIAGVLIPATETYPSSEQWGQSGWTATTLEQAEKIFKRELKKQKEKQ